MDAAGKSKPDVVTLAPEMLTARDHGLHVEVAAVAAQSVGSLRSLARHDDIFERRGTHEREAQEGEQDADDVFKHRHVVFRKAFE